MIVCISNALVKHDPVVDAEIRTHLKTEKIDCLTVDSDNVWCRDYMPIETAGGYVKFSYKGYGAGYEAYPWLKVKPSVWHFLTSVKKCNIVLDGGNCVTGYGKAFVTEIIYDHNPHIDREILVKRLEKILGLQVVMIPVEPGDDLGHTDGIVRFANDTRVFINNYGAMQRDGPWVHYQKELISRLGKVGLKTIILPYAYHKTPVMSKRKFRDKFPLADDFNPGYGYYINFLQLGESVLCPTFGLAEDEQTFRLLQRYFSRVHIVDCSRISMEGGLVNCVTRDYIGATN